MIPNLYHKALMLIASLLTLGLLSQACTGNPSSESPSETHRIESETPSSTSMPSRTPSPIAINTPTSVPPGVFALFFYPPLIMNYDARIWEDRSNYMDWGTNRNPATGTIIENYLQAKNLTSCVIGVQGPTGFQQVTPEKVQLGDVEYQVITFVENDSVGAFYIEDRSLSEYDYEPGLPIPALQANSSDWEECEALAEEVLATLHAP